MKSSKFRISGTEGAYFIEGLDSNGVWVLADPSAPDVETIEEAENDLELWESIPASETVTTDEV